MEKEHKHASGGFASGFLMGSIIGGSLVFLLGTKKGKQILKTLTENGFEGISEMADMLSEQDDLEEYAEGEVITPQKKSGQASNKRFFKRIKK